MIGIYKITNPKGKFYIGSSNNIERRWKQYQSLDCKSQKKIYSSLVKHGTLNHQFEVLIECEEEELLLWEQYCIDMLNPTLNICLIAGRLNSFKGKNHSEETKKKISLFHKGNKYCLGRAQSQETKQKISEANKGRSFSEEQKKQVSIRSIGNKHASISVEQWNKDGTVLIKTFDSMADVEKETGINASHISSCCSGKRKSAGGFSWRKQ